MKNLTLTLALLFGILQTGMALNPSRTYKQLPDKYNMDYKEVKVETNDGEASLNVWDFPCTGNSKRVLLIAHNGEGNMADYLRRVDQFRSTYNVVIFDYRGYGASSEFEIHNNMYIYPHFQDDYETMLDYVRKNHSMNVHAYGFGIGAGLSLGIGYNRKEVKRIIADTPFLSMEDLEERFSSWEDPMEVPFAGYEKYYEPYYALQNGPQENLKEVIILVGNNNKMYSPKDMEKLASFIPKKVNTEVLVYPNPKGANHLRLDRGDAERIMIRLEKRLN